MPLQKVTCPNRCDVTAKVGKNELEIMVPEGETGVVLWECPECMGRWEHDTGVPADVPPPAPDPGVDHHVFSDDVAEYQAGS